MTEAGVIVITATRFRAQERNRADAVERLVAMIAQAAQSYAAYVKAHRFPGPENVYGLSKTRA